MKKLILSLLFIALGALFNEASAQQGNTGTIRGHVKLAGPSPGNVVIRMGRDPLCANLNKGKLVAQEIVLAAKDGSLANVFVRLQGSFPETSAPTTPVVIDQRGCIYVPRVVGARVGQTVQIKNSDNFLHNVHSLSNAGSTFNIGQPVAGLVYAFKPKQEEVMMRIKCDLHTWMTTYVGVVNHPYFAVTASTGTFTIDRAPVGTYSIQAWQEEYGFLEQRVTVRAGATTNVEFVYTPKPAAGRGNSRP